MRNWILYAFFVLTSASCAHAQLFSTASEQEVTVLEAMKEVPKGAVLVLGENHGFLTHQTQHLEVLKALRELGHEVSVGMEFLTYTDQPVVDRYLAKQISEPDFLKEIKWAGISYDFYREQILFPLISNGETTLALNAPRDITGVVARKGLEGLSAEQTKLLPPNFTVGSEAYRTRFLKLLPHLPSPQAADRYFTAQSIWDDTMAWVASEYKNRNPEKTLVIIVGEFHVQFDGGLPQRLKARWSGPVWSLSQVDSQGLTPEQVKATVTEKDGDFKRAQFIWMAPL